MNIARLWVAGAIVALSGASSRADFLVTAAGPVPSSGLVGNVGNGVIIGSNTGGGDGVFRMAFTGNLTEVQTASFASDSRWSITNQTTGQVFGTFQPTTQASYSGTLPITRNSIFIGQIGAGNSLQFEAFESFDDGAGPDANWTNPSFNFTQSTGVYGGLYLTGTSFTLDTEGSSPGSFDSEIGLFNGSTGALIATDDDSGTGNFSLLNSGALAAGRYIFTGSGNNSTFFNNFLFPGTSAGNLNLRINGTSFFNGALASGGAQFITFDVVSSPAPAAVWMGLAGAGALGLLRRRFAKV